MTKADVGIIIGLWIVQFSGFGLGFITGSVIEKDSAKRQTEELFLKNPDLSLGEVAMCLDSIYRSEK